MDDKIFTYQISEVLMKLFVTVFILCVFLVSCAPESDLTTRIDSYYLAEKVHAAALPGLKAAARKAKYNHDVIDRSAQMAFSLKSMTMVYVELAEMAADFDREEPALDKAVDTIVMGVWNHDVEEAVKEFSKGVLSADEFSKIMKAVLETSSYSSLSEAVRDLKL